MGEPEAYEALKRGYIEINEEIFDIEKEPHGWCDGCCFYPEEDKPLLCPPLATKTCVTGGVIFKRR